MRCHMAPKDWGVMVLLTMCLEHSFDLPQTWTDLNCDMWTVEMGFIMDSFYQIN